MSTTLRALDDPRATRARSPSTPDAGAPRSSGGWLADVARRAARPVDAHALGVVRLGFGVIAVVTSVRILAHGWVTALWTDPDVHLQWSAVPLDVPSAGVLTAAVVALGALGALVAAGVATRVAAAAWAMGFAWLELLDKAAFLNHYWAMVLLALVLVAAPGDRAFAWGRRGRRRRTRRPVVPAWNLWLVRGQVAVVYVFAGLAKLDPDWLLRGEPMATWLAARTHLPVVGPVLALPGTALAASWAGLLFDLTIVAWLWWRPSRRWAMAAVVAFHAATWVLFPAIGVFPLLMVVVATCWLAPDWPAGLADRVRSRSSLPAAGRRAPGSDRRSVRASPAPARPWVLVGLAVWFAIQVVVPLRHLAVPGDVRWTEESSRFAWRVMAEDKAGWAVFHVTDDAGTTRVPIEAVLEPWQARVAATRPDMLLEVAHVLAARSTTADRGSARVTVDAWVAWNGRPHARLVDPTADLASASRGPGAQPWILDPPASDDASPRTARSS